MTHANGIVTAYSYDSRNRLTKIEHKDGATVVDGFTYALDSQGEITRVTYQDGAYWNYAYDGRYRVTSALRKNSGGTTLQAHAYVYDAGDNLVSKTVAGTGIGETQSSRRSGEGVSSRGTGVFCALGVLARVFSGRRGPLAEPQRRRGSVDEMGKALCGSASPR